MMCQTKYPVLLVHGTGFRDRKYLNYWGRIPVTLERRGVVLFYGNQDSWGSIENNAKSLKENLDRIISSTNCEKVNIIAHSKGGLEARYMISTFGMANRIASLTTIATPHHGSKTMDFVCRLPSILFCIVSFFANFWFRMLGDNNPDFYAACKQFTTYFAKDFNKFNQDSDIVYYQSYAAVMKNFLSDFFMTVPYLVVKLFDGESDGLIAPESAKWGNFKGVLKGSTNRGISHADEVDIRRMRLSKKTKPGHVDDICNVYVEIVSELKRMGY